MIWSKERKNLGNGNANKNIQVSIKEILEKFQEGYTKRDMKLIDCYIEELFSKESDALVVGTADSEWCLGKNEIKKLVEQDWKYWGDLTLDIKGAVISSYGDVAWVTTEGNVSRIKNAEKTYNQYVDKIQESLSCEASSKDKLIDTLKSISICMHEVNLGEEVIRPFRFTAILIKEDENWKFHNIHFSHPTTLPPDVRIVGNNKIS